MSDPVSTPSESSTLGRVSQELAGLVERVGRSTVLVDGRGYRPGTGTIVAADLVLTASHVVHGDDELSVRTADGRTLDATLAGRDASNGLALLRVPGLDGQPLPAASGSPAVGSLVVAVSRSWEGQQAASLGVVGAVAGPVRIGRGVRLEQVIKTDIALSRGLSGSPLVNTAGEWLGLVTAGLVRGLPLVIPQAIAAQAIAALNARGSTRRGYLGVALHTVRLPARQRPARGGADDEREREQAVLVVGVSSDGPADRAGLLVGDVILSAGGSPVSDIDDLQEALAKQDVDATLALDLLRGTTAARVDVVVGERPA